MLLIGKGALTVDGPAPALKRVRDGLKVVVFEQTAEALEKRLGFRVEEYGLRQVWPRVPDSPLLAGLKTRESARLARLFHPAASHPGLYVESALQRCADGALVRTGGSPAVALRQLGQRGLGAD